MLPLDASSCFFAIMPAVARPIHPDLGHGLYVRKARWIMALATVGASRCARLAMASRALVGIAPVYRRALCRGIGHAARREGEIPATAPVSAEENRERRAFPAHHLTAAAVEASALPQYFRFGVRRGPIETAHPHGRNSRPRRCSLGSCG